MNFANGGVLEAYELQFFYIRFIWAFVDAEDREVIILQFFYIRFRVMALFISF